MHKSKVQKQPTMSLLPGNIINHFSFSHERFKDISYVQFFLDAIGFFYQAILYKYQLTFFTWQAGINGHH